MWRTNRRSMPQSTRGPSCSLMYALIAETPRSCRYFVLPGGRCIDLDQLMTPPRLERSASSPDWFEGAGFNTTFIRLTQRKPRLASECCWNQMAAMGQVRPKPSWKACVRFRRRAQPVDATHSLNRSAVVGGGGAVPSRSAIAYNLPANRRRRAPQRQGHRTHRPARHKATGDLFTFYECQRQPRSSPRRRSYPAAD